MSLFHTLVRTGLVAAALTVTSSVFAMDLPLERLTASPDLSGPVVREVGISPDGRHVAYLKASDDDRTRQDLWVFDRDAGKARRLIDSKPLGADRELSAEEQQRRERQRTAGSRGIGHFQWAPDGSKLLFDVGDTLYLATLKGAEAPDVRPLVKGSDILDPRLSPKGRYVAFIRAQNLVVLDVVSGEQRQLTNDGGGTVHNAESEFVAQEEMGQPRGFWWSSDEATIAFKRFDESTVPIQRRFEIQADTTNVVEQHYPLAGGPNVATKLGVVDVASGAVRWIALGDDPQVYIPRVTWLPNGKALSYQRISRDQKTLELFRVELADLAQTRLMVDHSDTWIDLHDDLRFLDKQKAFVWAQDRDGRKHLVLVGLDGKPLHALTAGDWQVDDLLAIDEAHGYVYVSGDVASALERNVWRVKLDGSDASHPTKISDGKGWHVASFSDGHGAPPLWVDRYNDPSQPTQVSIRDASGKRLAWIEENRVDAAHPYHPYLDRHVVPQYGTIAADDGTPLNYSVLYPPGFDPSKKHPVFHYVYGGPHAQNVHRQWQRPLYEVLAQHGFIVFMLDNRGSARRGRKFSDAIYHRLGDVEVRDQLAGLDWLKKQPGVDADRIGVMGWSYGGYMSLMLLSKAPPGVYAAGISVAPVTRFELYDTFYTERYLGTPQENAEGYRLTSVFTALPGLEPPLLLVHGMADDNVLFTNSTSLMAAMQAQGKQFRLMTYPGGKHGLSTRAMTDHVDRLIVEYFEEMVKGKAVAAD